MLVGHIEKMKCTVEKLGDDCDVRAVCGMELMICRVYDWNIAILSVMGTK